MTYKQRHLLYIIYIGILFVFHGLLVSCHNTNSIENEFHHQNFSYITFATRWQDPEGGDYSSKSFDVIIYDANGEVAFSKKSMTPKDIASTLIKLEKGSYSASISDGTFYSVVSFQIVNSGTQVVEAILQRITSRITVVVENAPEGSTLNAQVLNASKGWSLGLDSDNKIAFSLSDVSTKVDVPSASAVDGTITTTPIYLMPTVPTDSNSYIQVEITESNGASRSSLLTCDRMESAGKYTVKLNYNDISTPLTLSTITINQWETLFVYSGEVLNPIN